MLTPSTVFTSLLIFSLLSHAVCAQSYGSASTLELVAAVGTVFYQAYQKDPVVPDFAEETTRRLGQELIAAEDVNDEIEKPYAGEDNLGDQRVTLYGYTKGMEVRVKGKKASFKTSHQVHKFSSRLSLLMREKNISQIDVQPGQLDIFPEGKLEPPVSVILPFEGEPLMPVTGYDWLDQSEGLAFVCYQSREAIAAIVEAVLSLRAQERTVGLDDQGADINSDSEDQISLFEDLGGQLYALESLPVYPPESVRVEEWHEIEGFIVELGFGVESIQVNTAQNNEWTLPGACEYSVKKINGGDNKKEHDESSSSGEEGEEGEKSDSKPDSGSERSCAQNQECSEGASPVTAPHEMSFKEALSGLNRSRQRLGDIERDKLDEEQTHLLLEGKQCFERVIQTIRKQNSVSCMNALKAINHWVWVLKKAGDYLEILHVVELLCQLPESKYSSKTEYINKIIRLGLFYAVNCLYHNDNASPEFKESMNIFCKNTQFKYFTFLDNPERFKLLIYLARAQRTSKEWSSLKPLVEAYSYDEIKYSFVEEKSRHYKVLAQILWLEVAYHTLHEEFSGEEIIINLRSIRDQVEADQELYKFLLPTLILTSSLYQSTGMFDAFSELEELKYRLAKMQNSYPSGFVTVLEQTLLFGKLKYYMRQAGLCKNKPFELDRFRTAAQSIIVLIEGKFKQECETSSDISHQRGDGGLLSLLVYKVALKRLEYLNTIRLSDDDIDAILQNSEQLKPYIDHYEGARVELANCYERVENHEEAATILASYCGTNIGVLLFRGICLNRSGQSRAAIDYIKGLKSHALTYRDRICNVLGICYLTLLCQRDSEESSRDEQNELARLALKEFKESIDYQPGNGASWSSIGHFCSEISKSGKLKENIKFNDLKRYLPRLLQYYKTWKDCGSAASRGSKAIDPVAHIKADQETDRTVHAPSYTEVKSSH